MRTALTRLTLTDFRSYARAELPLDGRPVFLVGPNGAGKTNLLEAISLFTPGRGLRGASLAEVGRRLPGEAVGRAWAVAAVVSADGEETPIGTGVEQPGASRRTVRIAGETVPPGRLAEHLRQGCVEPFRVVARDMGGRGIKGARGECGALAVSVSASFLPWGMAIAAGAMLYVISGEIIPETHERGREQLATLSLVAGFVLMMVLDVVLG